MPDAPYNPLEVTNLGRSIYQQLLTVKPQPMSAMLPRVAHFRGAGIYAIYYTGDFELYRSVRDQNIRGLFEQPIYVGKAVPAGGRRGVNVANEAETKTISSRLRDHAKSIREAENLDITDFHARWLKVSWVWIPLGESAVINRAHPLWNTVVDGFGSKAAGKGRFAGQRSRWDTLHPGREHARPLQQRTTESLGKIRSDVKRAIDASSDDEIDEILGDDFKDAEF